MDGEVLVRDLRVVQIGDDAHGLTVIRVDHAGMRVDGPAVRFGYLLPIVAVVTHQMTGLRIDRRSVRQCEGGVVLAFVHGDDTGVRIHFDAVDRLDGGECLCVVAVDFDFAVRKFRHRHTEVGQAVLGRFGVGVHVDGFGSGDAVDAGGELVELVLGQAGGVGCGFCGFRGHAHRICSCDVFLACQVKGAVDRFESFAVA